MGFKGKPRGRRSHRRFGGPRSRSSRRSRDEVHHLRGGAAGLRVLQSGGGVREPPRGRCLAWVGGGEGWGGGVWAGWGGMATMFRGHGAGLKCYVETLGFLVFPSTPKESYVETHSTVALSVRTARMSTTRPRAAWLACPCVMNFQEGSLQNRMCVYKLCFRLAGVCC